MAVQAVIEKPLLENSSVRSVSSSIAGGCSIDTRQHACTLGLEEQGVFGAVRVPCPQSSARGRSALRVSVLAWLLLRPDCARGAAIILGGGAGTRLYPLTKSRAKPAVPIGGAYRLIDVPMSNCINSGISKIYVLTQFNSTSLNRHLARTYNLGSGVRFGGDGFVEVLAMAQKTVLARGCSAKNGLLDGFYSDKPRQTDSVERVQGRLLPLEHACWEPMQDTVMWQK